MIRWMEIVLREESNAVTYRIGGDQFAVILTAETISSHKEQSERIFTRLAREGEQLGIPTPAAKLALIHYEGGLYYSLHDLMFQLGETMFDLETRRDRTIHIYSAKDLIKSQFMDTGSQAESHTEGILRWIDVRR